MISVSVILFGQLVWQYESKRRSPSHDWLDSDITPQGVSNIFANRKAKANSFSI